MTQLLETTRALTEEERRQVQTFAEFLITRRTVASAAARPSEPPRYINVDAVAGMCEGMGGDKTSVELAHEATEIRAAKFDSMR